MVERCDETCSELIIFSTNSGWSIFLVKTKAKTGFPFSNPFDISDGASPDLSTGIPYMYFTDIEMSVIDLNVSFHMI